MESQVVEFQPFAIFIFYITFRKLQYFFSKSCERSSSKNWRSPEIYKSNKDNKGKTKNMEATSQSPPQGERLGYARFFT